jgi:hypothetical protein
MEKIIKNRWILGLILITVSLLMWLLKEFSLAGLHNNIYSFGCSICLITGVLLVIPFENIQYYIWDNKDYELNADLEELISKLRYRATLYKNVSVGVLIVIILVIAVSFVLLIDPPTQGGSDQSQLISALSIRIGASVLLIFLVHILFRVFKYILRVAAFYQGKADAIEFNKFRPDTDLTKFMDLFTPDKYDISDLNESSISDNLIDLIKEKLKQ